MGFSSASIAIPHSEVQIVHDDGSYCFSGRLSPTQEHYCIHDGARQDLVEFIFILYTCIGSLMGVSEVTIPPIED